MRPDLILGIYSGVDDLAYKRLSSIAPTVVYRSAPWSADWKEQTEMVGQALAEATRPKHSSKRRHPLKAMGDSWPVLRGKTFTFGTYFPGGSGLVVYLPEDPRVAALLELGLKPSAGVLSLSAAKPGQGSVTVGMEQVDSLTPTSLSCGTAKVHALRPRRSRCSCGFRRSSTVAMWPWKILFPSGRHQP